MIHTEQWIIRLFHSPIEHKRYLPREQSKGAVGGLLKLEILYSHVSQYYNSI